MTAVFDSQIGNHLIRIARWQRGGDHIPLIATDIIERVGVHAWTANWDATGFDGDKQGGIDGKVLTLDVGGALAFRAQGDPKGKAIGTRVDKLDMLRRDKDNLHEIKLFGDMSTEEIEQAIRVVTRIPDEDICRIVIGNGGSEKLAEKMVVRKADMVGRLREF